MEFKTEKLLHGGDYNPEQWLKRPDILEKDLDKLDEIMARHGDDAIVHKFAEACRAWMIEAWRQGAERSTSK